MHINSVMKRIGKSNRSAILSYPHSKPGIRLFLFIIFISFTGIASAQDYRFALGVRLSNSEPTLSNSVTGKYFVTDRSAVEGIVSFGEKFGLGALLEIHKPMD